MDELDVLQEFGFSQNEAKVYLALVKKNPLNGYEIAKRSSITRTMVYDILKRLERKCAIKVVESKDGKMYIPVDFKEAFGGYRDDIDKKFNFLDKRLKELSSSESSANYILNIHDYENMVAEIRKQIDSARSDIYLSVWAEEAELFKDQLKAANERGVTIYFFSFNKLNLDFGYHFTYNVSDMDGYFIRRRITAVFDRERLIIGEGNEKIDEISLITSNRMTVQTAIDLFILDVAQLSALHKGGYIKDINTLSEYREAIKKYHADIDYPSEMSSIDKTGVR